MLVRFNKLSQQNLSLLPFPHLFTLPLWDWQQYEWSEDRIALKMFTQHNCPHPKSTLCPRNLETRQEVEINHKKTETKQYKKKRTADLTG